jgi:hypothetical protein
MQYVVMLTENGGRFLAEFSSTSMQNGPSREIALNDNRRRLPLLPRLH